MSYSTAHRNEIIDFFRENREEVFSPDEVASALTEIPHSTIYRLLGKLNEEGLIERVSGISRKAGYRFSDPDSCPHHLHLHCQKCGHIEHLSEEESIKIAELLEKYADFQPFMSSTFEGICRECQKK